MTMQRFRCTYCQELIPWEIAGGELGLTADEEPEPGKLYPYTKCYCGWSKFVRYDAGPLPSSRPQQPSELESIQQASTRERVEQARYMRIPVTQIRPNPYQPRRFFDQKALQ